MQIIPLGAGQDVGRSCLIASFEGRTLMLDCGMHMGFNDHQKFPDFSFLSKSANLGKIIDCVIITHFHTDHCGALPFFTEIVGFNGPIYMTHPTKAICEMLLVDALKIAKRNNDTKIYTIDDIKACMKKVVALTFFETVSHDNNFLIRAYPAGHVLGAAMFYIKINNKSIVYTGDYNMTPDKHLSKAYIDCLRPDLLITESTYGSSIRECRKSKEREFLSSVYNCVKNGGKVLIPTFALGRAQEMCLILDSFWEKMNLKVPIYVSAGMAEKATEIYRLFISYTNENIRNQIMDRNVFEFKHVKPLERNTIEEEGPMVVLASPGMLHSGYSLSLFLKICHDPNNMIVIPGFCVRNTVGDKVLRGEKRIEVGKRFYDVNLQVKNLAFSAHADAAGILELIRQCQPKNVMLVHGDKSSMKSLKNRIEDSLNITTYAPENGTILNIPESDEAEFLIPKDLIKKYINIQDPNKKLHLKISGVTEEKHGSKKHRITDIKDFLFEEK